MDQFILAKKLYYGIDQDVDLETAFKLFLESANAGNVESARYLGFMYGGGKGVEQDLQQSFNWFLVAAKNGDKKAQSFLVNCESLPESSLWKRSVHRGNLGVVIEEAKSEACSAKAIGIEYSTHFLELWIIFFRIGEESKYCQNAEEIYEVWNKAKFGNLGRVLGTLASYPFSIISYFLMKKAQAKVRKSKS